MSRKILFSALICALILSACTLTFTVPATKTGEVREFNISEPKLENEPASVEIKMGGGTLNIRSGGSQLIEGTVRYNVAEWEPRIERTERALTITQGDAGLAVPNFDVVNQWELTLGTQPVDLKISAGGYKGKLDFGGASLTRLEINDGASNSSVDFSQPNLSPMDKLVYATGASTVKLLNLSNARAKNIEFSSGAGSYQLAFGPDLIQDTRVKISSGASEVRLSLPKNATIRVRFPGGISNIDARGSWSVNDGVYSYDGGGKTLEVEIDMVVGSVILERE